MDVSTITGTVFAAIAAIAAAISAWMAWLSARANKRVADYMRDQWERDRQTQAEERKARLTNLLQSVRGELVVVLRTHEQQIGQTYVVALPQGLPVWAVARAELAAAFPDVANAVSKAEMTIEVTTVSHNLLWPVIQKSANSFWQGMWFSRYQRVYSKGLSDTMRESLPLFHAAIDEIDKALKEI